MEGASEGQGMDVPDFVDTSTDYGTTDDNTEDYDVRVTEGTEHHLIQLIIDNALSKLTQEGCIYSKDLIARITNHQQKHLRPFIWNWRM